MTIHSAKVCWVEPKIVTTNKSAPILLPSMCQPCSSLIDSTNQSIRCRLPSTSQVPPMCPFCRFHIFCPWQMAPSWILIGSQLTALFASSLFLVCLFAAPNCLPASPWLRLISLPIASHLPCNCLAMPPSCLPVPSHLLPDCLLRVTRVPPGCHLGAT